MKLSNYPATQPSRPMAKTIEWWDNAGRLNRELVSSGAEFNSACRRVHAARGHIRKVINNSNSKVG